MSKAKFFVIEGLDGCGKSTQLNLVQNVLKLNLAQNLLEDEDNNHFTYRILEFPNKSDDNPMKKMIYDIYLQGKINTEDNIKADVYGASILYTIDRYVSYYQDWKKAMEECDIIISGRYIQSNILYQGSKLGTPDDKEFREYVRWLYNLEYTSLGLPKPDKVFFLDAPTDVLNQNLRKRYGDYSKFDILESSASLEIERRRQAALWFCEHSKTWKLIKVVDDNNNMRHPEAIAHDLIVNINESLL